MSTKVDIGSSAPGWVGMLWRHVLLRSYHLVVRLPGVTWQFIATFLSSVAIGMLGLSILLYVEHQTQSFGQAGIFSAAFGLGNAAGLVVQGTLIDRFKRAIVILPASLICTLALTVFTLFAPLEQYWALALLLVALAGFTIPAIASGVRSSLPVRISDSAMRLTAYSLLSTSFQTGMAIGPLVVSALLLVSNTRLAIITAAALVGLSSTVYVWAERTHLTTRPALSSTRPEIQRRHTHGLLTLLVAASSVGLAAGFLAVGIPAAAISQHLPRLAGLAFAASALGDLCGGFIYGGRSWRGRLDQQLVATLICATGIGGLTAFATGSFPVLVALMFLAGFVGAPFSIITSALLDLVTHRRAITRAYTLLVGVGLMSAAAGNALGGVLTDLAGFQAAFLASAGSIAITVGWSWWRRATIRPTSDNHRHATAVDENDARAPRMNDDSESKDP